MRMFWDLVVRPGSAFRNLTIRTAVWLVIIMAVISIGFSTTADIIRQNREYCPETILEQPEMKRMIEEGMIDKETITGVLSAQVSFKIVAASIIGILFAFVLGWMVKSSVLLGCISLAGGKLDWKESVAVVGVSWIPFFFYHLTKGTAALLGWQIAPFAGAGAVLSSHLNIFVVWNLVLLTIGFGVIATTSRTKAFFSAFGYQIFIILLNLGLGKLSGTIK